jgi:hypothetical protein
MDLEARARAAHGAAFVSKARDIAQRLNVPFEWFLAGMGWETGGRGDPFGANLRTARNPKDGGGGLIGMPGTNPSLRRNAIDQLDDVERYLRDHMTRQGATRFETPEDFYLLIRGPYGFSQAYSYPMGGGKNKGQVLQIYRGVLDQWGVGVPVHRGEALTQLVGTWSVTIGTWRGVFVFDARGGVWWADFRGFGRPDEQVPRSQRNQGYWRVIQTRIQWGFFAHGDVRTFEKELPLGIQSNQGLILPRGQGVFQMEKLR